MTEADTRANYIDPQLKDAGWTGEMIIREKSFTDGKKIGGGKRGEQLIPDYRLIYKNKTLAVLEAKKRDLHPTSGLEQAKNYAKKLKLQFAYSSNGLKIYEFDMLNGTGQYIETYPTPEELYNRIHQPNEIRDKVFETGFLTREGMTPRFYQELAINKAVEAITDHKKRVLLALATGTGKTFISFQIIYKLFQARWNVDGAHRRPKVLFLADRNILVDQAINTFNPLEKELTKITGAEIRKAGGKVPTNFSIYFAIYQAVSDSERETEDGYFRDYPTDFFDLVVIDECHRGSANEEGSWREILDHFGSAIHLGLTATPKRQDNVDTYNYFGDPVYEYSLKEGINDGFLTPYKVMRITTNIDEFKYSYHEDVVRGEIDEDKTYTIKDFNRTIYLPERLDLIARTILTNIRPLDKTIVFCVDQPHAANLRDFINKHKNNKDPDYCVRITSDEKKVGRKYLEQFQNNDRDIPTIVTSSQMLTTGVDARNVRNIVLARTINSMTEFKQIIGRGTRLFDNKDYFTIIDFTGATVLFEDNDWDGPPEEETKITVNLEEGTEPEIIGGETDTGDTEQPIDEPPPREKIEIRLPKDRVLRVEDIQIKYLNADGKPVTASQLLTELIGHLPSLYKNEQQLRDIWSDPNTRLELLEHLKSIGIGDQQLQDFKGMFESPNSDVFDILNHISHSKEILTRKLRAAKVKDNEQFFKVYSNLKAQHFLKFLLERYEADGIKELNRDNLTELMKLNKSATQREVIAGFGGNQKIVDAFLNLQRELYKVS